jgi:hypothetical protein
MTKEERVRIVNGLRPPMLAARVEEALNTAGSERLIANSEQLEGRHRMRSPPQMCTGSLEAKRKSVPAEPIGFFQSCRTETAPRTGGLGWQAEAATRRIPFKPVEAG